MTKYVAKYRQEMSLVNLLSDIRETIIRKTFGKSLGEPFLTSFLNHLNSFINCFSY